MINVGETVTIVGKSGSGKSTLMHILTLSDTPTNGRILYRGENVAQMDQRQKDKIRDRDFGFIFSSFLWTEVIRSLIMSRCH